MQKPADELDALMRAAIAGDEAAYRRVLDRLAVRLRAIVRGGLQRSGRGPAETEDIVQDTLLAIHLKRHTWDQSQPLGPWVRAIAQYKLIDHLRRKGYRDHVDIEDYSDVIAAPASEEKASLRDATQLLASLPEKQRIIVEGVSIEGRSAREVGDKLGMSEGAVRVALHRALKSLASLYRAGEEPS